MALTVPLQVAEADQAPAPGALAGVPPAKRRATGTVAAVLMAAAVALLAATGAPSASTTEPEPAPTTTIMPTPGREPHPGPTASLDGRQAPGQ